MREDLRSAFESIDWSKGNKDIPRSGPGSTLNSTAALRERLPQLFEQYKVNSFLDAPCGDWNWMQTVDLRNVDYAGFDISSEVITANAQFAQPGITFDILDITSDPLPKADLMLCRDCLFHLRYWLRVEFFRNFVASGTPLLLTTSHIHPINKNVRKNGGYKRFNMLAEPFNFPEPIERIVETTEDNTETKIITFNEPNRYVGLWTRDQIESRLDDLSALITDQNNH
ncbi:MAG: class I SAM-dependent methyltransferase [Pseudomonadota bacterium]